MSLSKAQKGLLKRAQAQAGLSQADYQDALECVAGVTSSTDKRIGDDHLDVLMAYFETIFWRGVDAGTLQPSCNRSAPFQQRGYWTRKNPKDNTSRDRWTGDSLAEDIERIEAALMLTGVSRRYLDAIKDKVTKDRWTPPQMRAYRTALERTLAARRRLTVHGRPSH